MKFEKTQPGNRHKLTVKQHVIPVRTIERFAGPDGMVEVRLGRDHRVKRLPPDAGIFWRRRAWDQRAERGYMKQIEDRFQPLADRIVSGTLTEIPEESMHDVNQFFRSGFTARAFSLWIRSRHRS